jgi:transcriptional regulator with XRE-family HTH domain
MGRSSREKPALLAQKLTYIRRAFNLSQDEIIRRLALEQQLNREEVSKYERGLRVPSLLTLLRYAKFAGLIVDDLIDDEIQLPEKLPTNLKRSSRRRKTTTKEDSKFASKSVSRKRR